MPAKQMREDIATENLVRLVRRPGKSVQRKPAVSSEPQSPSEVPMVGGPLPPPYEDSWLDYFSVVPANPYPIELVTLEDAHRVRLEDARKVLEKIAAELRSLKNQFMAERVQTIPKAEAAYVTFEDDRGQISIYIAVPEHEFEIVDKAIDVEETLSGLFSTMSRSDVSVRCFVRATQGRAPNTIAPAGAELLWIRK